MSSEIDGIVKCCVPLRGRSFFVIRWFSIKTFSYRKHGTVQSWEDSMPAKTWSQIDKTFTQSPFFVSSSEIFASDWGAERQGTENCCAFAFPTICQRLPSTESRICAATPYHLVVAREIMRPVAGWRTIPKSPSLKLISLEAKVLCTKYTSQKTGAVIKWHVPYEAKKFRFIIFNLLSN